MLISYPAMFYFTDSGTMPFFITFPDFPNSATQGENIAEALNMATEWLGIKAADFIENNHDLPIPSDIQELNLTKNNPYPSDLIFDESKSFISMVLVDLSKYLDVNQPVKKTLTIPKWADKVGKELNLNFSQTLTDAIAEKKVEYHVDKKRSV